MPKLDVIRSITINAPIEKIKQSLTDFQQWPVWSPWLIMERDTELTFSKKQHQVGAAYNWKGKLTGEGGMVLKSISTNSLEMDLAFIKPFKSEAKVFFDLDPIDDKSTHLS